MRIKLLNKGKRARLICERKDGTTEMADLGPNVPFHDMAHFVVERRLNLADGFFGNIYKGYSVAQLSDKETIKTLPLESIASEIITRALQSLASGACTIEQFRNLIEEEFTVHSIKFPLTITEQEISFLLSEYKELISRWEQLKEGESLILTMEIQ